jgi:hypothetical protein
MIKSYSLTISRSEILNLYSGTTGEISVHSISEWLKSKTDKQFIVIERQFIIEVIEYIELNKYSDGFLGRNIKERWDLTNIKEFVVGR